MSNSKLVVVHTDTKKALDGKKLVECETYDSVIQRLLQGKGN